MRSRIGKILIAVAVDVVAVSITVFLALRGVLSLQSLPLVSFCLFWGNYVFLLATTTSGHPKEGSGPQGPWKLLAVVGVAGVYFAGALWGIILYVSEREWYELLAAAFAVGVGTFCLAMARRIRGRTS